MMPFPPYPPWLDRREWDTLWRLHAEATAATRRQHEREHEGTSAATQRARAEHATLHEHELATLGERLHAHALAHAREHEMTQRALDKAEAADTLRFESVNEFRKTLTDQATTFARTETVEARLQAITARQDSSEKNLNERRDALAEQLGNRLSALEKYENGAVGHAQGSAATVAYVLGGIGILIGISGILLHFIH